MANPQRGTRFRWTRRASGVVACATTLSLALGLVGPSATGQSSTSAVGELVTAVSRAQANVDELNLGLGSLQESVNQALVDLHDKQAQAEQARLGANEAKRRLDEAQANVEKLRAELDELTRSQYRGATAENLTALSGAGDQRDVLDRSLFLRQRTDEKQSKLEEAERARAEAANEESVLREASALAASAAADAEEAENNARELLEANRAALAESVAERDAAQSELDTAERELAAQRPETAAAQDAAGDLAGAPAPEAPADENQQATETPAEAVAKNAGAEEAQSGVVAAPYAGTGDIPEEVKAAVSQAVIDAVAAKVQEIAPGAPTPSAEQLEEAVRTAVQAAGGLDVAGMSSQLQLPDISPETIAAAAAIAAGVGLVGAVAVNHTSLENPFGSSTGQVDQIATAFAEGLSSVSGQAQQLAGVLPDVATAVGVTEAAQLTQPGSSAQIEAVIARAESQIGVPYVWGGGDANGPTTGVNGGSLSGFDCSGLVLYAYSAAGISLPHYTGYQYQRGTQVPASEAKRGDLLFWGPGGSQHVAIYLGDGMMIEAPQTGMNVQITPVRWSGMTPNAVRLL